MGSHVTRRSFLGTLGAGSASVAALGTLQAGAAEAEGRIKIVAVACSPRRARRPLGPPDRIGCCQRGGPG